MHPRLLLTVSILCSATFSAVVDVPPSSPAVRILGRVLDTNPNDLQWSWSASGAVIAFDGTSCSARLSARGAIYRVRVDGADYGTLDLSSNSDTLHVLASGLDSGSHVVELRLRTEAQYSTARFHGFRIDGVPGTAPEASSRRIEFYGNSITCGYGILDSVNTHPFSIQTEDEGRTFAAHASDSLGADRHTVCWSGKGVVQNYGQDTANPTLPELHRQILTWDANDPWDFSRWIPQVVVIDLGTNDFSTVAPDSAKFHNTYAAFVDTLHARYPSARFVLVDGPMLSDGYPAGMNALSTVRKHLDNIVTAAVAKGISATHLKLTPQDGSLGYGADWHPSRDQAKLNGQELTTHLRGLMGWSGLPARATRAIPTESSRIVRVQRGYAVQTAFGSDIRRARIVDASGRCLREVALVPGETTRLPSTGGAAWLRIESPEGTQVLAIPPRLP